MRAVSRATRLSLIVFAVFVFLGISGLLARALAGGGEERSLVLDVVRAQARGESSRVLVLLPACARVPACAATVRSRAPSLRGPGAVELLNYDPSVRLALTRQLGTGRVAWRAGGGLPVVQCVRVRREGPLTGGGAELLAMSDPIEREGSCP